VLSPSQHDFNELLDPMPLSSATCCDAIQAPKDPLEVPIGSVTRLRAKRFKEAFNELFQDTWAKVDFKRILNNEEAFNGLLQDTWAKVDFKRILNNEEQAVINLIHVQEGLVGGTKTITQGLGEED